MLGRSFLLAGVDARLRRATVKSWLRPAYADSIRDTSTVVRDAADRKWWLIESCAYERDSVGLLDGAQSPEEVAAFAKSLKEATTHLGSIWLVRFFGAGPPDELEWSRRFDFDPGDLNSLSPLEIGVLVVFEAPAQAEEP